MKFEHLPCEGGTTQSVAASDSAARIEAASPRSAEICLNKILSYLVRSKFGNQTLLI